jgi:hypothetical protein
MAGLFCVWVLLLPGTPEDDQQIAKEIRTNGKSMECNAMAIKWNDLKHKSSPEFRANLNREADAELERIGFNKLRQTDGENTAGGPQ